MIALKRLKVKGFRAYTEEKDFVFDTPAIFLFGENHRGKSSTLNAIEWCMFGSDCVGKDTGIRERVDWEIPNRNVDVPEVFAELELEDSATGECFVVNRRWISPRKDEVKVTLPDGRSLEGKEGTDRLRHLCRSSFRDFLTTVYQHQEAIRAILAQEPRERNDAIDRLLGLSDYRNILSGIKAARLGTQQKKMNDTFDGFVREVGTALRTRESDLKDKRRESIQRGLNETQLTEKGALEVAKNVKTRLTAFSSQVGLVLAELEVPAAWPELPEFQQRADREVKRFRSEMPDVSEQQSLFRRRAEITALKEEYEHKEKECNAAKSQRDVAEKEGAKLQQEITTLQDRIAEAERKLTEGSAKGAVITKARHYLGLEGIDGNICPVCETPKPGLLAHLDKEYREKYEKALGVVENELKALKARLGEVTLSLREQEAVSTAYQSAYNSLQEIRRRIAKALNLEISQNDDPTAVLSKTLASIRARLEELEQAVSAKQRTLDAIASFLEAVELILDILGLQEKKKIVEQIQQASEYLRMEALRDEMAVLVDDLERIKNAISDASREAAEQKVTEAGRLIDNYFRRITDNPAITKIQFSVEGDSKTGLNSYVFKDQHGKELTPILSQGDLNAMALSIFLGMAGSKETNQPFGFVMLDDPSQSLGSQHKEKLVEVLNEVLGERMVVLSSMDKELQDIALSRITKLKTRYIFSNWTPDRGPEVKKE